MNNKDYTKFSNNKENVVAKEEIVATIPEVETVVEANEEPQYGVVTDCVKLNVRKEPDGDSKILCTVDAKDELVIVESESTEDFYKVITPKGVEGFCMKRYVTVIP